MDKKIFCDEMSGKLSGLDRYFQLEKDDVAPATAETGLQQARQAPRRNEARTRVSALRARVESICADAAPLTDSVRTDTEQEFVAILQLLR
jgi:hypothetical protein